VTSTDSASPTAIRPVPNRIVSDTTRVLLAEALIVPTGLLTVAYLTRRLGPSDYGLYSVVVALIAWLEWGCSAPFARAAVRLVGATADWQPIASLVVRTQLAIGVATALGLWLTAPWLAVVLDEPRLPSLLRVFALDLPLFALAQAHLHGGAKSRRHAFGRLGLRKRVDQFGACPRRLTQCSVDGDGLGAAGGAQYWRGWFLAEGKRRRQDPDDDDEIRKMPFQTGTRDCYGSVAVRLPRGPRVPKPPSLHVRLGAPPGRPCVSIQPQQYPGARAMQSAGSL